jgi:anti-anti-sigma regulatory factor
MSDGVGVIVLPARTRLAEAESLVEWILACPDDVPIVFDCSQVEEIGTAGVLAIGSAVRLRSGSPVNVVVKQPPEQFIDAFSDLGLFQDLMKMEFQP